MEIDPHELADRMLPWFLLLAMASIIAVMLVLLAGVGYFMWSAVSMFLFS